MLTSIDCWCKSNAKAPHGASECKKSPVLPGLAPALAVFYHLDNSGY